MIFTASQIIAALVDRLGGEPVVLTVADCTKWGTKYPTSVLGDDDGTQVTVSISPGTFDGNPKLKDWHEDEGAA